MKKNINLLGNEFANTVVECKKEEDRVRWLHQKYVDALRTLEENNDKRREILNKIRLEKVEEINKEIEQTNKEIEAIHAKIEQMRKKSCEENGHNYRIVDTCFKSNNSEPYGAGTTQNKDLYQVTYECTICNERKIIYQDNKDSIFSKNSKAYNNFLGNKLCKNGKSLQDNLFIKSAKLQKYLEYLQELLVRLCDIFGHDVDENYTCRCCGMNIDRQVKEQALYKGIAFPPETIIPADVSTEEFIIDENNELIFNLARYPKRKRVVAKVKSK